MLKFTEQNTVYTLPDHTNELNKSEHSDNCLKILLVPF